MAQPTAPSRTTPSTTFYAVAYDIPNDKRRTQVHKLLKGFGKWTEFSLFECFLTKKELAMLHGKLDRQLNPKTDRVRIYSLCENCLEKLETVGIPEPTEDKCYLI